MSPAPRLNAAVALAALISVALVSCGSDVVNLLQPKASAGASQGGGAVTAGAAGSDAVAGVTSGGVGGTSSGSIQTIQGNVQQVNYSQGWFTVRASNNYIVTVSLPYGASRNDVNRFNNLRNGDYVRAYVVYYNNQRAELRNFY